MLNWTDNTRWSRKQPTNPNTGTSITLMDLEVFRGRKMAQTTRALPADRERKIV